MPILTFSLSHHTAPIALRETAAIPAETIGEATAQLCALDGVDEAVIVSTCNRTELSLVADNSDSAVRWLSQQRGIDVETLRAHGQTLEGADAVRHGFRVAAGLDSMVLGEPQILGQVKQSVAAARDAGTLGSILERFYQSAFSAAKAARSQTAIGENPVSFAFAGVRLAERIFDDLAVQTVLLIGAGEMIELFARHLERRGVRKLMFANRTLDRAEALAHTHHGAALPLDRVGDYLPEADIIITSTASAEPILRADDFRAALRVRKRKPMCVIDMAVPRDIDPASGKLPDVYLYTVDELKAVIERNQESRRSAADQAEAVVDGHVAAFEQWLITREAASTIRALRRRATEDSATLVARAMARLDAGDPADIVLPALVRAVGNKLLHPPTVALRSAHPDEQTELLAAVRALFSIADERPAATPSNGAGHGDIEPVSTSAPAPDKRTS